MDYSLLLGLEKDKKEIVVGIVDSIGSFDLWKTLESKGKMLTRGGDVTVVSTLIPSSASLMIDPT
jgi:1-phosphatidylinositol-3-phosphate 5-kinase